MTNGESKKFKVKMTKPGDSSLCGPSRDINVGGDHGLQFGFEQVEGKADDVGVFAGEEGDEGVVIILDAVGAGFVLPEVGGEALVEPLGGEFFDAADGDGAGEAVVVAMEEGQAGDDKVLLTGEGGEHAAGVGAVGGFIEDLVVKDDDGVAAPMMRAF